MKYLYLFLIFFSFSSDLLSQSAEVAPFGGRIIEKGYDIVFKRSDGSEISCFYEDKNNWYLSKPASHPNKLQVPGFVNISFPIKLIYVNSKREQFTTLDKRNWTKLDIRNYFKFFGDELPVILNITRIPDNPVEFMFFIEFTLSKATIVKFQIFSLEGHPLKYIYKQYERGYNKIEVNVEELISGCYIYNIKGNDNNLSGLFFKY
jgi:hypothetical protein